MGNEFRKTTNQSYVDVSKKKKKQNRKSQKSKYIGEDNAYLTEKIYNNSDDDIHHHDQYTRRKSLSESEEYFNTNIPSLNHPLNDDINKYYIITDKVLGMGNFSIVKLGINRETNESCAIKIVDKTLVKNKPQMLLNEIDILLRVKHPNIIELKDLFECEDSMMLCMELVKGGELFDKIIELEHFSEESAAKVMYQLFDAISYLHDRGIVHRDLKPENLLLANEEDVTIKIADFGLSKLYSEEMMSTACGTPGYVAPEILCCKGYTKQIDMWSAGVIMYILLCGYPPFYNENEAILFESIMAGQFEFHSPYWDHISHEAKDLILHLLVVNPLHRLSAKEALQHPWFLSSHQLVDQVPTQYKQNLLKHNNSRKASIENYKEKYAIKSDVSN